MQTQAHTHTQNAHSGNVSSLQKHITTTPSWTRGVGEGTHIVLRTVSEFSGNVCSGLQPLSYGTHTHSSVSGEATHTRLFHIMNMHSHTAFGQNNRYLGGWWVNASPLLPSSSETKWTHFKLGWFVAANWCGPLAFKLFVLAGRRPFVCQFSVG